MSPELERRLASDGSPLPQAWGDSLTGAMSRADYVLACIEAGRRLIGEAPERSVLLAQHAVELSDGQDRELRARAQMFLGLALRRRYSDYKSAEKHFQRAQNLLLSGGCHAVLQAKCLELRAVNLYEESRSREALRFMERAVNILRDQGEAVRLGRLLIDTSGAVNEAIGPEAALRQAFCCEFAR